MNKISIRSTPVLVVLGILALGLFYFVESTKGEQFQDHHKEKIAAAEAMQESLEFLKEKHFKNEVVLDNINDPNDTRIIGTQFSEITSGRGSLPIKLSTTNPNFAALMVELYREAGLKSGDHIVIGATGSFPAMNIAASVAAKTIGLKVTYLASVTSSSWGANDPDYTYLDIHKSLKEANLVDFDIAGASIGANQDIGRTLSPEGRDLAIAAIARNDIELILGNRLGECIDQRMDIIRKAEKQYGKPVQLYVNIGGGIASLGSKANADNLSSGLTEQGKLDDFPDKKGVVFQMVSQGKPFINMLNVQNLMNKYELPRDPFPLPPIGKGKLFKEVKYNLLNLIISFSALLALLIAVILFDRRQNALGKEVIYESN